LIELRTSQPSPETLQRVMRIMLDAKHLGELTGPQVRAVYQELEAARDALSHLLDRADGKSG
jgi:hypothetical protein